MTLTGKSSTAWARNWPMWAIYLMGLAEILGVDLQAEVQRKMAINRARVYENKNGVLLKAQKK